MSRRIAGIIFRFEPGYRNGDREATAGKASPRLRRGDLAQRAAGAMRLGSQRQFHLAFPVLAFLPRFPLSQQRWI